MAINLFSKIKNILSKQSSRIKFPTEQPYSQTGPGFYLSQVYGNQRLAASIYEQSIQATVDRLQRLRDYDAMDTTPIVSKSLDTYADDATTHNDYQRVLKITSENDRIEDELNNLFFNIFDIDFTSYFDIRSLCKYGDKFTLLNIEEHKGITSFISLPTAEIEREEAFDGDPNSVRFKWLAQSAGYFDEAQIAHFRIRGDDNYLPYGRSFLEGGRRSWKQLQLLEDAMLIYRVSRAAERRVFHLEVAGLPPEQVTNYIEQAKQRVRSESIINPATGDIDLRYRISALTDDYWFAKRGDMQSTVETLPGACIALNTKIALLDGRNLELQEIIKEFEQGKNLWTYSCDPKTGKPCGAPITWAGITRKNTQVMKLTLDNGKSLICTPDHKLIYRTGGFVEAKDLKIGDSLMPFNREINKSNNFLNGYEKIYNNKIKSFEFTHRIISEQFKNNLVKEYNYDEKYKNDKKYLTHHLDYNKLNNEPTNFVLMSSRDHTKLHHDYCSNPYRNQAISKSMKEFWSKQSEEYKLEKKNQLVNGLQEKFENNPEFKKEFYEKVSKSESFTKKNNKKVNDKIIADNKKMWQNEEYRNKMILRNSTRWNNPEFRKRTSKNISQGKKQPEIIVDNILEKILVDTWKNGYNDGYKLSEQICENIEFKNHFIELNPNTKINNFPRWTLKKIIKKLNYSGYKHFAESVENFNHKIINIEYLEETMDVGTITVDGNEKYTNNHTFALSDLGIFIKNSNLNDIEDVQFIEQHLITSLGVPKAFLQYSDDLEGKSSASKVDIRFARAIQKIQRMYISELSRIAMIHLISKGYKDEEIIDFEIKMNNPSAIMELGQLEIQEKRFEIYDKAVNNSKAYSEERAKKEILHMNDDDIIDDIKNRKKEAKFRNEVKQIEEAQPPQPGMPGSEPSAELSNSTENTNVESGGEEKDKTEKLLDDMEAETKALESPLGRPFGTNARHNQGDLNPKAGVSYLNKEYRRSKIQNKLMFEDMGLRDYFNLKFKKDFNEKKKG